MRLDSEEEWRVGRGMKAVETEDEGIAAFVFYRLTKDLDWFKTIV